MPSGRDVATKQKEHKPTTEKSGDDIDRAVDGTFPVSDSPAKGGTALIKSEDGDETDEDSPE
jgi:hypothetical protein